MHQQHTRLAAVLALGRIRHFQTAQRSQQGFGQRPGTLAVALQQMESHALGGFRPYAGQTA